MVVVRTVVERTSLVAVAVTKVVLVTVALRASKQEHALERGPSPMARRWGGKGSPVACRLAGLVVCRNLVEVHGVNRRISFIPLSSSFEIAVVGQSVEHSGKHG